MSRGQEAKHMSAAGVYGDRALEGEVPSVVRGEEELET